MERLSPHKVSIQQITDVFIYLKKDKGCSVLAVKGYSATFNNVASLAGTDLAKNRIISTVCFSGVLTSFAFYRRLDHQLCSWHSFLGASLNLFMIP